MLVWWLLRSKFKPSSHPSLPWGPVCPACGRNTHFLQPISWELRVMSPLKRITVLTHLQSTGLQGPVPGRTLLIMSCLWGAALARVRASLLTTSPTCKPVSRGYRFSASHSPHSKFPHRTVGILIPVQISSDADWGKLMVSAWGMGGSGQPLTPRQWRQCPPPILVPLQSVTLSDLHFEDKEAAGPFARMHLGISVSS